MDHRTNRTRYEAQVAAVKPAERSAGESQAENPEAGSTQP